jgi:hypothetical protein
MFRGIISSTIKKDSKRRTDEILRNMKALTNAIERHSEFVQNLTKLVNNRVVLAILGSSKDDLVGDFKSIIQEEERLVEIVKNKHLKSLKDILEALG